MSTTTRRSFLSLLAGIVPACRLAKAEPRKPKPIALETNYAWGMAIPKPLHGVPRGSTVRLRLRNDDFATAFVRTGRVVSRHSILDFGSYWHLGFAQAQTIRG